jgi:hypothetical protein
MTLNLINSTKLNLFKFILNRPKADYKVSNSERQKTTQTNNKSKTRQLMPFRQKKSIIIIAPTIILWIL